MLGTELRSFGRKSRKCSLPVSHLSTPNSSPMGAVEIHCDHVFFVGTRDVLTRWKLERFLLPARTSTSRFKQEKS